MVLNRSKEERKQRCSDAWMQTITLAGQKVATARDEETLALEIRRLEACRVYLEQQKQRWVCAPRRMPPTLQEDEDDNDENYRPLPSTADYSGLVPASVMIASSSSPKTRERSTASGFATQNPFAAFQDDDDDSSLSEEDHHNDNDNDKVVTQEDDISPEPSATVMTMRRLLIRVLTTVSELHTRVTNLRRDDRDERYWTEGVDTYATVVECLLTALTLADEEYARLFPQAAALHALVEEEDDGGDVVIVNGNGIDPSSSYFSPQVLLLRQQLADDAQVVMIALEQATREREHYEGQAHRRMQYLQTKLAPQWESRDAIKQRMGADRWENNPHPKQDYARLRQEQERELRAIEVAMGRLEAIKSSLEGAYQRSVSIFETAMSHAGNTKNGNHKHQQQHRYNGMRPNYQNARVSLQAYPDPTDFGWIFTGSVPDSHVEFFERTGDDGRLVKMDWYYTTATIKTSIDHPSKGPNQLFGKQVTPPEYQQILENPRAHTNVRYRTRNGHGSANGNRNSRGGRGGGGGRGGFNRGGGRGRGRGRGRRGNGNTGTAGRGGGSQ